MVSAVAPKELDSNPFGESEPEPKLKVELEPPKLKPTVEITEVEEPTAASTMAALISSIVVVREASNVRSTTETFGVGTRIATPSSLPFSSGNTRPTALAAPVDVGIMDKAAARAR